jgi:hypothetical protein
MATQNLAAVCENCGNPKSHHSKFDAHCLWVTNTLRLEPGRAVNFQRAIVLHKNSTHRNGEQTAGADGSRTSSLRHHHSSSGGGVPLQPSLR